MEISRWTLALGCGTNLAAILDPVKCIPIGFKHFEFLHDSLWQVSVAKLRGSWVVLHDVTSAGMLLMEGLLHPTAC